MSELISNPEATIIYSEGTGGVYLNSKPETKRAPEDPNTTDGDSKIAYWGDSNDFPDLIDKSLEKNGDLASGLDWQARALYSGGLKYDRMNMETGELTSKPIFEIEQFKFRNWMYLMQATKDFYKYINVFPEIILTKDRKKIHWLTARPAGHCRYAKQDKDGHIRKVYLNANWADGLSTDSKLTDSHPALNMFDQPESLKTRRDSFNYMMPLGYPTGKSYYQLAGWNALRNNGWLDLSDEIAKFKMAIMKNQMTIKYIIEMPDYWMAWKYPDWESFNAAKKITLQKAEIKKFDDFIKGSENAGKTITVPFKTDKHTGSPFPGWKITPIDDKIKDGIYLEDSVEATIKIFSALGLDPALFGIIPGKGGSNRSGSDKREALNIYISLLQPHADLILRPLDFISWYNGWSNEKEIIKWSFNKPYMQTLDEVTPSKRDTVIPEEDATK
ncbi:MAG: hypothetical protein JXR07_20520 [Reichenbachiella sp.]